MAADTQNTILGRNIQEHVINNKKVHVIDNAMPDHVVNNWIDFYENQAVFRRIGTETKNSSNANHWLSMIIDLKMRYEIFDIGSWLIPMIINYEPNCTEKHFMRSFVNMCTTGDNMKGHSDTPEEQYNSNEFFVVSLVFMNPHVKDPSDSGFELDDGFYVENVFNRMIIFDGRLWHRPDMPTDRLVRLTMYNSFRNPKMVVNHSYSKSSWFR